MLQAPCCAEFASSRAAIRRHPREFYAAARTWLGQTRLGSKQAARAAEYAWHLIFQPQAELRITEQECLCLLYGLPRLPRTLPPLARLALPLAAAAAVAALGAARSLGWQWRRWGSGSPLKASPLTGICLLAFPAIVVYGSMR